MMWNLQSYPTTVLHERMVTCLAGSKHTLTPPVGTHNPQELCPCILLEWNDNLLWCHICDVFSNLWTTCWVLNFIICFVSLVKRQNIIGHVVCTSVLGGSHVSGWERQFWPCLLADAINNSYTVDHGLKTLYSGYSVSLSAMLMTLLWCLFACLFGVWRHFQHRLIAAVIRQLPPDWKRPLGRPSHTRLRAVEADLDQLNIGLASAWMKAAIREDWRCIVDTTTLQRSMV